MIRLWSSTALIALHLAAWNPTIAACSSTYTIDDLGTLGGTASGGTAINAAGMITGSSYTTSNNNEEHAFRYVDSMGMIDLLSTLQQYSVGRGINSFGQIAATIYGAPHKAIIVTGLTVTDIGKLGGGLDDGSDASDINDRGQVTGSSDTSAGDTHAFVWTAATGMRDIGTLGGNYSVGRSINESGQIAGESGDVGPMGLRTRLAFRFTEDAGMISLGTLSGGTKSAGYGINDSGQVVGESDTGHVVNIRHFKGRWFGEVGEEPHAFLWTEGVGMRDLGSLGGCDVLGTEAMAISNNGVVVGDCHGQRHAFRWTEAEGMIDLNTLLPPNSGWVLWGADDVNDKGQITGLGLHNGVVHAYRLNSPGLPTQLTVNKFLEHPDASQHRLFDLQIDGVTVKEKINSGSTGPQAVSPGAHTVSESGVGTSLNDMTTVIGGDCAADGTVTLAEGNNKTCTITNYDNDGGCSTSCCTPGGGTEGCLSCRPPGGDCP